MTKKDPLEQRNERRVEELRQQWRGVRAPQKRAERVDDRSADEVVEAALGHLNRPPVPYDLMFENVVEEVRDV